MVQLAKGGKTKSIEETRYQGSRDARVEPSVQTSIIFPKSLHAELQRRAFFGRKSMSAIVVEALRAKFADEETRED